MDTINVYEDVTHVDLGNQICKLEEQNQQLLEHIHKLDKDIEKLCTELTNMKQIQQNLSRNISELFNTAKLEIQRKDRIILELRQEIDDLVLGQPRYPKRPIFDKDTNQAFKRHKNNTTENNAVCQVNDNQPNSRISSPEISHKDLYSQHKLPTKRYEDRKSDDDLKPTLRHSSRETSSDKSIRENTKYNDNRQNERYRRYRHDDRVRWNRSNHKYRNYSRDRYRSRSTEKNNQDSTVINHNVQRRYNRRYSRSDSVESKKSYFKNNNRSSIKYNTEDCKNDITLDLTVDNDYKPYKNNEIFDLTSDQNVDIKKDILDLPNDTLEDGEITTESDNLIIEENYINDTKEIASTDKAEVKALTIEEYRCRMKHQISIAVKGTDEIKVEDKIHPNDSKANILKNQLTLSKSEESVNNVSNELTNNVSTDYSSDVKICNDSDNSFTNMSNTSFHNNQMTNNIKQRRRRCVVIGIKERT